MRRRSVCTPLPPASQRSNLPADRRTSRARPGTVRGWREKTANRGRRTKTTVRPSVGRSVGRADRLPPPPPPVPRAGPSTTRGGRAANAAGQCRESPPPSPAARPGRVHAATAAACPPPPLDRPGPMTYRPPAATAAAAMPAVHRQRKNLNRKSTRTQTNRSKIEPNPTCFAGEVRRRPGCHIAVVVVVPVVATPLAVVRRLLAGRHRLESRTARRRHVFDGSSSRKPDQKRRRIGRRSIS